ncbi:MAG: hypothetical protein PHE50_01135 [Dehalococcoidales bacterium]|nr:hypothetical protein [Dehalococcoidales bacterium]
MFKLMIISQDTELKAILKEILSTRYHSAIIEEELFNTITIYPEELSPDIILLDVDKSIPEGIQNCLNIRKEIDIPVLMISRRGAPVNCVRLVDINEEMTLTPPINIRSFYAKIDELIMQN